MDPNGDQRQRWADMMERFLNQNSNGGTLNYDHIRAKGKSIKEKNDAFINRYGSKGIQLPRTNK